jgi:hypothetical protein
MDVPRQFGSRGEPGIRDQKAARLHASEMRAAEGDRLDWTAM